MGFKIEKILRSDIKYMVDAGVKIEIADDVDRKQLAEYFTRYDKVVFNADGILDNKELKYLQDKFDKKITKEKLAKERQRIFGWKQLRKDSKITPLMKDAIKAIDEYLPFRTYYLYADKSSPNGFDGTLLPDYLEGCKNKDEVKKIKKHYAKLVSHLKRFAKRSDYNAELIFKILNQKEFGFSFCTDGGVNKKATPDDASALYFPDFKVIFISKDALESELPDGMKEEIFIHETVHAFDDFAVKDTSTELKELSGALNAEIKPMLRKEIKNQKELLSKLKNLRVSEELEKIKKKNPGISQKELNIHRKKLEQNIAKEFKKEGYAFEGIIANKLIQENTWLYIAGEDDKKNIGTQLFLPDYFDAYSNDLDGLAREYMAFAVQFYLSASPLMREKLKYHDPQLYNFIKKRFLPLLLK